MVKERTIKALLAALPLLLVSVPSTTWARASRPDLVVVAASQLPPQAREPGEAMHLYAPSADTLYLYVEQGHGHQIAIFDVTRPAKIVLKGVAEVNAPGPFDFLEPVGQHTLLIQYRNGSGTALLDVKHPREPRLRPVGFPASESYVIPAHAETDAATQTQVPHDYLVIARAHATPIATVPAVVQRQIDEVCGTTYLLGANGLTVIRNIGREHNYAEMAAGWTSDNDHKDD